MAACRSNKWPDLAQELQRGSQHGGMLKEVCACRTYFLVGLSVGVSVGVDVDVCVCGRACVCVHECACVCIRVRAGAGGGGGAGMGSKTVVFGGVGV